MDITLNRHLWLLTGRHNDFVTPTLNTGRRYGDAVASDEVKMARDILHLSDKTTDYYVIGAMAALVAFRPDAGPDTTTLFRPMGLHVKAPTISGGSIRPASNQHPSLLHRPTSLPVARRWYITRTSEGQVSIAADTGYFKEVPYRFAAGVVYVEWPEEIGFRAGFAPTNGTWEDGSQVIISTEPSGYPYKFVADAIKNSVRMVRLMSTQGTLSSFHAAQDSIQKVGALTAAVVQWGAAANP